MCVFIFIGQRFQSGPKMFCYYSTYAQNRPEVGQFLPEDIDPELCTHVIMAFGDIIQGTQLKASGWNDLPNGKDSGKIKIMDYVIMTRTHGKKCTKVKIKLDLNLSAFEPAT